MKKGVSFIILATILSSAGFLGMNTVSAATKTTTKKKTTVTKTVKDKTIMTMPWSADAQKLIGNIASFDYNYSIRNAVIKKIENYAKKHKAKTVTAKLINSMNE